MTRKSHIKIAVVCLLVAAYSTTGVAQDFSSSDKYVPPSGSPFDYTDVKGSNINRGMRNTEVQSNFIKINYSKYALKFMCMTYDLLSY